MEEPIFISKIKRKQVVKNLVIFLLVGIAIYFRSIHDDFNSRCFAGFMMFIYFIIILIKLKVFILKDDELIVRRKFFTSKFDKIYKKNQISKVLFTFIPGKFGGDAIIVYTIFIDDFDSYIIYLNPDEINEFIKSMIDVGINVENDLKK